MLIPNEEHCILYPEEIAPFLRIEAFGLTPIYNKA